MGLEQQVWSLSDGKRLREVKAPSWEFTLDRLKSVWGLRRDGGGADASLQG